MTPRAIARAIVDRIAPLGWQDDTGFHLGRPYLADEVRRALHPEAYPGSTHDHPNRDSERLRGGRANIHPKV